MPLSRPPSMAKQRSEAAKSISGSYSGRPGPHGLLLHPEKKPEIPDSSKIRRKESILPFSYSSASKGTMKRGHFMLKFAIVKTPSWKAIFTKLRHRIRPVFLYFTMFFLYFFRKRGDFPQKKKEAVRSVLHSFRFCQESPNTLTAPFLSMITSTI